MSDFLYLDLPEFDPEYDRVENHPESETFEMTETETGGIYGFAREGIRQIRDTFAPRVEDPAAPADGPEPEPERKPKPERKSKPESKPAAVVARAPRVGADPGDAGAQRAEPGERKAKRGAEAEGAPAAKPGGSGESGGSSPE